LVQLGVAECAWKMLDHDCFVASRLHLFVDFTTRGIGYEKGGARSGRDMLNMKQRLRFVAKRLQQLLPVSWFIILRSLVQVLNGAPKTC
jgi:hypothetical protein